MTAPIRIGVIGTSWFANLGHLPFLTADERVTVAAICGRNRERAQKMATQYGIPQVFTDYRAMLIEGNVNAVVIVTPDDEHFPMAMAALDAGLHVLCEKPLACTAAQARQMVERAEAQGVRHMTNFSYRWSPLYRYVHDLIAQGAVGRIYHAQFSFMSGHGRNPNYAWRFDPQRANGALGDLGSHTIDLARYLVGDIARVNARLVTNVQRTGADGQPGISANDAATVMVEFTDGTRGTVELSAVARTHDPAFEQTSIIHGEAGSLIANFALFSTPPRIELATGTGAFQELPIPADYQAGTDPSQASTSSRSFVDAILSGQTIAPSFYEGWQAQRVIDAALASHQSGKWVTL
jgi:predicted dehydrogenase